MVWFYIGIFVALIIVEALTYNLITIWMAIASLITSIYAYFFPTQILPQAFIFIVLSIILIALTKPISKKLIPKPKTTNSDSLIGEIAVVISEIDTLNSVGQVKVKGQIWSAKTYCDRIIEKNEKVKIEKIEGVKLVVSPL